MQLFIFYIIIYICVSQYIFMCPIYCCPIYCQIIIEIKDHLKVLGLSGFIIGTSFNKILEGVLFHTCLRTLISNVK